jgi:imidazolonepropionase
LSAPDLQNTGKALRLHRSMQLKPLRIRSIFSPPCGAGDGGIMCARGLGAEIGEKWLPAIFQKKLSSLLEIPVVSGRVEDSRAIASAAAAIGYNIRLRVSGPTTTEVLEFARSAGAIALVGSVPQRSEISRTLADLGCVEVILTARLLTGNYISKRSAIDDGVPIAFGSGYRHDGMASMNPQFLLYMACHCLGMTVEEAIVAATYNAACSLRLSHVTGSLSPGKSADICIVDVDDYHELARRAGHHDLCLAMRAGKIIYRRANLAID